MQTNSISRQDNWARFMQLSSQARLRNDGLSGNVPVRHSAMSGKAAAVNTPHQAPGPVQLRQVPLSGSSYTTARPAVEARILGGRFDAYT